MLTAAFILLASANVQAAKTQSVNIYFDGTCPKSAVPALVELNKAAGDQIEWSAYDRTSGAQIEVAYEIFFDPFKGKSMESDRKGVATSPRVAADVPMNVEFKYTIYSTSCPQAPLDPSIMIR
jgi:hypothetical protein